MNRLESLLAQCEHAVREEARSPFVNTETCVPASVKTHDGVLDILYYRDGHAEVIVLHDNDPKMRKQSDTLCEYLSQALSGTVDIDGILAEAYSDEDEYQQNGFADEADYWQWKEGYIYI